mmetsp:Transcript_19914/g.24143  ORF Transcript_19914/g.24143 Transcript_19914/m.24143 type:complete len:221 (-) Transcript_19914:16-678(-)
MDLSSKNKEEEDVESGQQRVSFVADGVILPPLKNPDVKQMRSEAKLGIITVVSVIIVALGLMHALTLNHKIGSLPTIAWWICFVIAYGSALLVLIFMERIIRGDPGIIKRSTATCLPVPDIVRERISQGLSLDSLRNIQLDQDSYCVRCCVWRPPRSHHCSICQRCVRNFDHHCGFYGKCIAGTLRSGNMPFFLGIFVLTYLVVLSNVIFLIWAIVRGPS